MPRNEDGAVRALQGQRRTRSLVSPGQTASAGSGFCREPRPCRAPSVVLEKTVTHEERLGETCSILQTEVTPRMMTF